MLAMWDLAHIVMVNRHQWIECIKDNRSSFLVTILFSKLILTSVSFDIFLDIAAINTSNRQKHEDVHTLGPCSLARLRYELEQKDPNKEPPIEWMVYQESRKRDPKRSYKTSGVKTKTNIEKMNKIQLEIAKGDKSNNIDPYHEVVKQHSGQAFLQGRGVKVSRSKGKEKKRWLHNGPSLLPTYESGMD